MSGKITEYDGIQYREVSRKANVGERIKIVQASLTFGDYVNGTVMTVEHIKPNGAHVYPYVDRVNICKFIADYEYVVLEPLAAESIADFRAQVDGLTQTVASLTLRVTELERAGAARYVKVAEGTVTNARPSFAPLTRDEIVEMAKKDVAELERDLVGRLPWKYACMQDSGHQKVNFVVNREKRTVVALLSNAYCGGGVNARAKSRCAPDDCFNVHIGRAIALRRALGLTVPSEYYEAPQPTEARVGDVMFIAPWTEKVREVNKDGGPGYIYDSLASEYLANGKGRITDDSRAEVSA
jgi:hypothetical protein